MPEQAIIEDSGNPAVARFSMQPMEKGYATTIGNAMRRVLLSSIPGAAVVGVKISNVLHEFQTIEGVEEDVSEIILNLKEVKIKTEEKQVLKIKLQIQGPCEIKAGDLEKGYSDLMTITNPDFHIATVSGKVNFNLELIVNRGKGYLPAEEQILTDVPVGTLAVDAIYSPILEVNYIVEPYRVGGKMDYERLVLDVRTDGTVNAAYAVLSAAKILNAHFNLFGDLANVKDDVFPTVPVASTPEDIAKKKKIKEWLLTPISSVDFKKSVTKIQNCCSHMGIHLLAELVKFDDDELKKIRNFGNTTLEALKDSLKDLELTTKFDIYKFVTDEEIEEKKKTLIPSEIELEEESK